MDKLIKSNGKFMSSADGAVAGLSFNAFNDVIKFLDMYNAEPELSWYELSPHLDDASGVTYETAICYVMPKELRACTHGMYNIEGAVIVAFHNEVAETSVYVLSDVVLAALGERKLILLGECEHGKQA